MCRRACQAQVEEQAKVVQASFRSWLFALPSEGMGVLANFATQIIRLRTQSGEAIARSRPEPEEAGALVITVF